MKQPRHLKDVARELANDRAKAWPVEVDGIRLMVMTEQEFYRLLDKAGYEARLPT